MKVSKSAGLWGKGSLDSTSLPLTLKPKFPRILFHCVTGTFSRRKNYPVPFIHHWTAQPLLDSGYWSYLASLPLSVSRSTWKFLSSQVAIGREYKVQLLFLLGLKTHSVGTWPETTSCLVRLPSFPHWDFWVEAHHLQWLTYTRILSPGPVSVHAILLILTFLFKSAAVFKYCYHVIFTAETILFPLQI